ncbi:hypothetical protein KM043_018818 [Ampulex compressa]|nr:hypothetical protein KM043_018818 [Ampulex compressa]
MEKSKKEDPASSGEKEKTAFAKNERTRQLPAKGEDEQEETVEKDKAEREKLRVKVRGIEERVRKIQEKEMEEEVGGRRIDTGEIKV